MLYSIANSLVLWLSSFRNFREQAIQRSLLTLLRYGHFEHHVKALSHCHHTLVGRGGLHEIELCDRTTYPINLVGRLTGLYLRIISDALFAVRLQRKDKTSLLTSHTLFHVGNSVVMCHIERIIILRFLSVSGIADRIKLHFAELDVSGHQGVPIGAEIAASGPLKINVSLATICVCVLLMLLEHIDQPVISLRLANGLARHLSRWYFYLRLNFLTSRSQFDANVCGRL